MANESDFTIEGLDKFIEGISKLNKAGDKLAKAFGALPAGRSKEAKEARISGLGSIQELGNALKRSTSTINSYNRAMSQAIQRDVRLKNLEVRREEQLFAKKKKADDLMFKHTNIELDRAKRLDRQKERDAVFVNRQRTAQLQKEAANQRTADRLKASQAAGAEKLSQYSAMSGEMISRKTGLYGAKEEHIRSIEEEAVARRRGERRTIMLEKFAVNMVKAPFKALAWGGQKLFDAITFAGKTIWGFAQSVSGVIKGVITAIPGALKTLYNYSGRIAGQRETTLGQGINVQAPKYLEAAFAGITGTKDITSAVVEAQRTPGNVFAVRAGISPEDDAGMATLKAMDYARKIMSTTPKWAQKSAFETFGISQAMSFEAATSLGATSEEEYKSRRARAVSGMAEGKIRDKEISEFYSRIRDMGVRLETYMVNAISPMLGSLESLGTSIVDLFKSLAGPDVIPKVISQLQLWANELTAWVKKPETKDLIERTIKSLNEQFAKFEDFLKKTDWEKLGNDFMSIANYIVFAIDKIRQWIGRTPEEQLVYEQQQRDQEISNLTPQERSIRIREEESGTLERAARMAQRLSQDVGISEAAAAGFMGNPYFESAHFNKTYMPNAGPNSPERVGIAHWLGDRKTRYIEDAKRQGLSLEQAVKSDEFNYQFLRNELNTSEIETLRALRKAKTISEGAIIGREKFERPGPGEHFDERRIAEGFSIYNKMRGGQGSYTEATTLDEMRRNRPIQSNADGRVNNSYMEGMFSFGAQTPVVINMNINDALSTGRADITASRSVGGQGANAIANTLAPMFAPSAVLGR